LLSDGEHEVNKVQSVHAGVGSIMGKERLYVIVSEKEERFDDDGL
jgi:hypothetical protein